MAFKRALSFLMCDSSNNLGKQNFSVNNFVPQICTLDTQNM